MRPEAELDIECFNNWFLVGITDRATGTEWDFQMIPGTQLDIASIEQLLRYYTIVTFSGQNYDIPMLVLALQGADCAMLKAANDDIICNKLTWFAFYKKYRCYPPKWLDHIDISEVAPGVRVSLKQYMCRMSSELVQDTPVDFNKPLPLEHAPDEIYYCRNDRRGTGQLIDVCRERVNLRVRMSERYGVDLRSKSDAQMAEAMVKAEWSRKMLESIQKAQAEDAGAIVDLEPLWHTQVAQWDVDYNGLPRPIIPHYEHGTTFKATLPPYISFVTSQMQEFHALVANCDFLISNKEEAVLMGFDGEGIKTGVVIPPELKGRDIIIGASKYRVGIGGLHSQESSVAYRTIPGVCTLRTADVKSYYPSLIINNRIIPPQLGPLFLEIYTTTYDSRLEAKSALKKLDPKLQEYLEVKAVEGGFKIVLNGTFGKLFSRFSIFYYPQGGIQVTIGGQLSLLMLIERLEIAGIRVVSANTDGIEMLVPWGRDWMADDIIKWWETVTGLGMDSEKYLALYSRDVNNYVSLHFDGTAKRKGVFGESGVLNNKHPDLDICADAVVAFLQRGVPLRETITACNDIRKFIRVRGAKGGAVWFQPNNPDHAIIQSADGSGKYLLGGEFMGRAVRWYYAKGSIDYIIDAQSLNKVAGSDGARPVMRLPKELPGDVDHNYYVTVAEEMLYSIGCGKENQ